MSGHNKWSKIKRQKGSADAARSEAFGKIARRIVVESKAAKGDTSLPNLRAVIEKARELNMPKDKITAAVEKGIASDAAAMESIAYETYGPGGGGGGAFFLQLLINKAIPRKPASMMKVFRVFIF
jgi:transcriptional/translational regulatory protein YebC/TACO1